jgi:hypothetical protein
MSVKPELPPLANRLLEVLHQGTSDMRRVLEKTDLSAPDEPMDKKGKSAA